METKLKRIANLSRENKEKEFEHVMPHFNYSNLKRCFDELDGKKALGVDGCTKDEYGKDLESNLLSLLKRMKEMKYRPAPVRQVLIPKANGKLRPLGISNFEDKIVQMMFAKILESIYDPIFCKISYGFRRNISAHNAITDLIDHLKFNNVKNVIDVDLENYFGNIRHNDLLMMLKHKIKDQTFLRYISRMFKAGIITGEGLVKSDIGVPQGSIMSPVLANVYAHYAIDLWFEKVVPKHIIGKVKIFRYCDDFVVCCTDTRDTKKIVNGLEKRVGKFGLKLNKEKTKVVQFNKYDFGRGLEQESFDFLGFTLYLSRAIKDKFITIKCKTSKKSFKSKLQNVKDWVKLNRFNGKVSCIWNRFRRKLQGHISYFGVTNNGDNVSKFIYEARRIFFKWMNRRSQKKSFNWETFSQFIEQFPLPKVIIYHQLYKSTSS